MDYFQVSADLFKHSMEWSLTFGAWESENSLSLSIATDTLLPHTPTGFNVLYFVNKQWSDLNNGQYIYWGLAEYMFWKVFR